MELAQIGVFHAQKVGHLAGGELAQLLAGIWREKLFAMGLKALGQARGMVAYQKVDTVFRHCHALASVPVGQSRALRCERQGIKKMGLARCFVPYVTLFCVLDCS